MTMPTALSTAAILAALSLGVLLAPVSAPAQTPPPTPPNATTADDDDLPPPVSRRTGTEDDNGPPPVTPGDDGQRTSDDDATPPPIRQLSYYAAIDGQQVGPLDEQGLIGLIKEGRLTARTRVWTKGMADWQVAAEVAEMAALIETHAPPPVVPQIAFFVVEGGQQAGPFTLDQIKEKIASGAFTAQSRVWRSGMADWMRAGDVPELASLLKKAPKPELEDGSAFLAGRWEMGPLEDTVPGAGLGTLMVVMELQANGQFRNTITLDYQFGVVPIREVTTSTGTFTAKYKSADTISIVSKGQATHTKTNRSNGRSDQPRVEAVDASFDVKIIDPNTINAGGTQNFRRVQ